MDEQTALIEELRSQLDAEQEKLKDQTKDLSTLNQVKSDLEDE